MKRLLVLSVAVLVLPLVAHAAEPLKISIGWNVAPTNIAAIAWVEPQTIGLRNYGKSYIAEPIHFQGGGRQLTALAAGELDIAMTGAPVVALAVNNAHLHARIIADVIQDPCNGVAATQAFYVAKDSGIKDVADLKGKVAAVTSIGSGNDVSLSMALRKAGLAMNAVTKVEAPVGAMLVMLNEGKVQAAPLMPQDLPAVKREGKLKPLFTQCQALGPIEMVLHFTTAEFIAAHRPALVDMMADLMQATRWFEDPKNRPQALRIAAAVSKQPVANLASWLFTKNGFRHDPDLRPNLKGVQASIDQALEFGMIKKGLTVDPRYVDLSIIADAKKQLDGR